MYDIIGDIKNHFEKKREIYPCHSNRASQLGAKCIRQLVYFRLDWEKQILPDPGLQSVFDEGNLHEKAVKRLLEDCNYTIVESQRSLSDTLLKKYNISGHIDFFISKGSGRQVLAEVKSMSPYIWESTHELSDFDRYSWSRKYVPQMQIYLFGTGENEGVFILKNKSNGQIKTIPCFLDLEIAESLLQKAEQINAFVKSGEYPDRISDIDECKHCPFSHLCMPDMINDQSTMLDDPELILMLERREELHPMAKEYEKVDKEIKAILKNIHFENILIGDFKIEKSTKPRRGYTVEDTEVTKISISRLIKQ